MNPLVSEEHPKPRWHCDYVDESGQRCPSRETRLYFDRPNRTPGTYREVTALCDQHKEWQAP